MPYVIALDIATVSGWSRGLVGGTPEYGSVRFSDPGANDEAVFHAAMMWAHAFFRGPPKIDLLTIERLLPPEVVRGASNTKTLYRLAGLHGVILAVAHDHEIDHIETRSTGEIRGHFIGMKNCRRKRAKAEVLSQCMALGWMPKSDNEGDALALWHYECSRIDPMLALQVSPLFRKGVVINDKGMVVRR